MVFQSKQWLSKIKLLVRELHFLSLLEFKDLVRCVSWVYLKAFAL